MNSLSLKFKVHHYQLPCRVADLILKNFNSFFLFLKNEQHFAKIVVTNVSLLAFLDGVGVGV